MSRSDRGALTPTGGSVGLAVVGERRLNPLSRALRASPPEVATAWTVQPLVGGGQRPAGAVLAPADAVGRLVPDQFAAGFVTDVPDGFIGTGFGVKAAEFGDGGGGLFDLAGGFVASGDHNPCPRPLHPPEDADTCSKDQVS